MTSDGANNLFLARILQEVRLLATVLHRVEEEHAMHEQLQLFLASFASRRLRSQLVVVTHVVDDVVNKLGQVRRHLSSRTVLKHVRPPSMDGSLGLF